MTNGGFNNDYIQYESRGNKDRVLRVNEYLDIIRPYLTDKIMIIKLKVNGKFN